MSTAWWMRARSPAQQAALEQGRPVLVPGGRQRLVRDLARRIGAYVPEWRNQSPEDAGVALVRLFGEQLEPVLARVERLPEKGLVELLSTAGIALGAARPARVGLVFSAAATAASSVVVPRGTRVSSAAADGSPDEVIWETQRDVHVTPATIEEAWVHEEGRWREIDVSGAEAFQPLGAEPRPGSALLLGLQVDHDPRPTLTLGIEPSVPPGAPTPVADGGEPVAAVPLPLLRWEALVDGTFRQLEVVLDQTDVLRTSGVVELRLPDAWPPAAPPWSAEAEPRRWLRLRLLHGRFAAVPLLDAIALNAASALAVRTIRDEVPQPVGGPGPKRFRLSQTPIRPGSVQLYVDEGAAAASPGVGSASEPAGDELEQLFVFEDDSPPDSDETDGFRRWEEVDSLVGQGPGARVFQLDAATGVLTFGDDRDGMTPPDGVRNVVARAYEVGGGPAGGIEAEEIGRLVTSIGFLQGVANPRPASGGAAQETLEEAMVRGPRAIKARRRAVTAADASLLARAAEGADIAQAFALPCVDPSRPGAPAPGVIGLFVVPARRPNEPRTAPPTASQETLRAAARHVAREVGPLGARVVAASPRFHEVRVETTVALDAGFDVGEAVTLVLQALDAYLDPLLGGEERRGWALGEGLRHARLVRRVLDASAAVLSVPFLNVVVDGIRYPACADVALSATGLTWPVGHEVVPLAPGDAS